MCRESFSFFLVLSEFVWAQAVGVQKRIRTSEKPSFFFRTRGLSKKKQLKNEMFTLKITLSESANACIFGGAPDLTNLLQCSQKEAEER